MAGESNETRVLYRVIADFTELSKKARAARKDIADLKAEEAALNATSAKGSVDAERAHARDTKASIAQAAAVEQVVESTKKATAATTEHAAATERSAQSTGRHAQETGRHVSALSTSNKILNSVKDTFSRLTAARDRDSASTSRNSRETSGLGKAMNGALGMAGKFQKRLDKIGDWRPHIMPPFIALVPIIGSVIALLGPLIAGLGAVGGAAIGLASNIASIGGAALGVVPALATLLSVVGAIKMAFGGIGKAFKANTAAKAAGAKGGGSEAPARAEITTAEEISRAWEKYRRAIENVRFAQDDLDEARSGYTKRLNDLTKAVNRNAASEARAAANSQLARENYANVLADPGSTKGDKMMAAVDVTDSKAEVVDAHQQTLDDAAELRKMQADGIEGDKAVIMAKRALVDAMWAERDAYIDTQNAGKDFSKGADAATTAVDEFKKALDELSPSARATVLALIGMNDAWKAVKRTVQEAFFSEIVGDIERLRLLFPPLTSMLSDTAGAVGRVADKFLLMITSQEWIDDFYRLGKQNVPIIENLGDAFLSILNVFRDLTFAAGPFTIALTESMKEGADNMERMMSAARDSGSLAKWLETVHTRMQQWWRIIKNIGLTLFNFGAAAGNFGQWITDAFEGITEGWLSASEGARVAGSPFQTFLENIKPLLSEVGGLLGDFFGWFAKTAADPVNIALFTDFVKVLRDDLGPILADVMETLSTSGIGMDLVNALVSILEALDTFLNNGGLEGMGAFWNTATGLADAFAKIVAATPAPVISALTSSLGILAALRFFGLNHMFGLLLSVLGHKGLGKFTSLLSKLPGLSFLAKPAATAAATATGTASGAGGAVAGGGVLAAAKKFFKGGGGAHVATATTAAEGAAGGGSAVAGGGIVAAAKKFFGKGGGAHVATAAADAGKVVSIGGKVLKGIKAANPVGLVALATELGANMLVKDGKKGTRDTGGSLLAGAASGAGLGSLAGGILGSVIPGAGTAAGVGVGAAVGGVVGAGAAALGIDTSQWDKTGAEVKDWWDRTSADAGEWASSTWESISGFFSDLGKNIGEVAGDIWSGIQGIPAWLGTQWENFTTWLGDLPGKIAFAAGALWGRMQNLGDWLTTQWENFGAWLAELPGKVAFAAGALWGQMQNLGDWLALQWENFTTWLTELPARIGLLAMTIWDQMQTLGSWLALQWENFSGWLAELPGRIGLLTMTIWNGMQAIGTWLALQWTNFTDWLTLLPGRIGRLTQSIWAGMQAIGTWLATQWTNFSAWCTTLPARIGLAAIGIWDKMTGIGDWLSKQLTTLIKWATETVPNAIKSVGGAVWDYWSSKFNAGEASTRNPSGDGPGKNAALRAGSTMNKVKSIMPAGTRITSSYRTPAQNKAVGGVTNSYHTDKANPAVDIGGPTAALDQLHAKLKSIGGWRELLWRVKGHFDHVHVANTGGQVPGAGTTDTTPAMLTPGEFVLRKAVTRNIGADNLAALNSGAVSFAQMLKNANKNPSKGEVVSPQFFNTGGLVPQVARFASGGMVTAPERSAAPVSGGFMVQHLDIHNPVAETAAESMPKAIRKLVYLGGGR